MNSNPSENDKQKISFIQGGEDIGGDLPLEKIRQKISEFANVKNVGFLLGSGASSSAIPSMKLLHENVKTDIGKSAELSAGSKSLYESVLKDNIEDVLSILYAKKYYLEGSSGHNKSELDGIAELLDYIENTIYSEINIDLSATVASELLDLYRRFYKKIALRNKDLSRVNVFTTNNDLLNEKALDSLSINYNNGFGGGIDRVFNPARFHYTFSRKIDTNLEKFEPLENMVYLYKLHGSVSWIEKEESSPFNIREVRIEPGSKKPESHHVLIYPTPLKQSQSLGSPYSDLIREFQSKLEKPNSVLFVIGYSFSDEHINNIIYQSMASNSSISIVIFGEHKDCPLAKIQDSRIFRVFGESELGENIHYFEYIVEYLLPNLDENTESTLLEKFVHALKKENGQGE